LLTHDYVDFILEDLQIKGITMLSFISYQTSYTILAFFYLLKFVLLISNRFLHFFHLLFKHFVICLFFLQYTKQNSIVLNYCPDKTMTFTIFSRKFGPDKMVDYFWLTVVSTYFWIVHFS